MTARAITKSAWSEQTSQLYPKFLSGELRFSKLTSLFGAVVTTRAPVIANDAPRDPRRGGLPPGHPSLDHFLGLPLFSGVELVGVLGLANASGGYSEATIEYLEPMVKACANIIAASRSAEAKLRGEAELQRLNTRLEAANAELAAFSYSVAHDLRAPLRGMNGFATVLLEDYGDKLGADGLDCLREIHSNAQKMAKLIDALLSLSRLTRSEMRPEHVDLSALASEVGRELAAANPEHHVELVVEPELECELDHGLARVLVENLLANAWKFAKHVPSPRVEVGKIDDAGARAFFVRDNGAGFDMAFADKLFSPFQRLHSATDFPGTGIGLATVQRIVHRHGGRVWAEGQVGAGATFHFSIPTRGST